MSDNLLEAVEHAIVRVRADSLAGLQLSVESVSGAGFSGLSGALHSGLDDVQRVPKLHGQHTACHHSVASLVPLMWTYMTRI